VVGNIGNKRAEIRKGEVGFFPKGQDPPLPPHPPPHPLSYPDIALAHKIIRETRK
jgi:hypothetical protein